MNDEWEPSTDHVAALRELFGENREGAESSGMEFIMAVHVFFAQVKSKGVVPSKRSIVKDRSKRKDSFERALKLLGSGQSDILNSKEAAHRFLEGSLHEFDFETFIARQALKREIGWLTGSDYDEYLASKTLASFRKILIRKLMETWCAANKMLLTDCSTSPDSKLLRFLERMLVTVLDDPNPETIRNDMRDVVKDAKNERLQITEARKTVW